MEGERKEKGEEKLEGKREEKREGKREEKCEGKLIKGRERETNKRETKGH